MAEKKTARKTTQKSTTRTTARDKAKSGFTEEERAAMRDRAREIKAERSRPSDASDESVVLDRIATMAAPDRAIAERLHAIVRATAPELTCRLWYGMPAYAKNGKVVCFFQDAAKFKARYATLGFSDQAKLDEGDMWPTSYALKALADVEEARIVELVKRAVR
jgi:uncharacterized protein YdhG (YjbR/CyaY superfamily)